MKRGKAAMWGTPKSPAFRGSMPKTPATARTAAAAVVTDLEGDVGKAPTLRKADVPKWKGPGKHGSDPRDWLKDYEEYAELVD